MDGKTKTGKINGGAAGYGVCVWKFGCLLNKKNEMKWVCGNRQPWGVWVVDDCETPFFLTKKNETSISFVTSFWNVFF